eukprot:TRINITY_DN1914_c1_g1_i1.p1 TRINITY_DN1914_c1_g1~~TRINITY_DN1914_c1_g1_i1.p1  ORF type:complete len:311 (-),score=117.42 TRINITY_DN1914_c1_g1_i1:61-966(-)
MSTKEETKVVFITGCSEGGIGHSLAVKLGEKGCKVYASARKIESLSSLDELKDLKHKISKIKCDVTDRKSLDDAVNEIIKNEGKIDIVIANAGIGGTSPLMDIDLDDFKKVYETNVFGLVSTFQLVLPHMARRGEGKIVLIGSAVGYVSTPWAGCYSSSKAAVHSLGDALRKEVAGLGIQVQIIAPGGVKSNIAATHSQSIHFKKDSFFNEEPVRKAIEDRTVAGQVESISSLEFAEAASNSILAAHMKPYFTFGTNSLLLWIAYYLPPFITDFMARIKFKTDKVRSWALQQQGDSLKKEN